MYDIWLFIWYPDNQFIESAIQGFTNKFKCSKFTLSTNSWYNSLIVFGRMPVALAKSACVHLSSPSFVDSKILIILIAPSVIKYHVFAMPYGKSYFIADMDNSYQPLNHKTSYFYSIYKIPILIIIS